MGRQKMYEYEAEVKEKVDGEDEDGTLEFPFLGLERKSQVFW